jgi:hypothetical protein
VFLTPLRWLWDEWPDYLKEGPDTARTIPTIDSGEFFKYGLGATTGIGAPSDNRPQQWWHNAVLRVYNEWYKWPEDPDATTWDTDGNIAVPLSHAWSRTRGTVTPSDSDDYTVAAATEFDVRNLAEVQARFRSAMERDVLSYNRYMELVSEMFNADGSREVDQVPIQLVDEEVGVNPRDLPATDGASLGQWQSLFDFSLDHQERAIVAPEHCILTYMLTIRFPPIIDMRHPLCSPRLDWAEQVGDPEILGSMPPQPVDRRDLTMADTAGSFGSLPAGWQWRSGHDVIGARIDNRNSFPYMDQPTTLAQTRDATRIKDAFRSQSLGDYVCDLYVSERSHSPIGNALESYFSGMTGSGANAEFPKQGKMK